MVFPLWNGNMEHLAIDHSSIVNKAECLQTQTIRVVKAQDWSLKDIHLTYMTGLANQEPLAHETPQIKPFPTKWQDC